MQAVTGCMSLTTIVGYNIIHIVPNAGLANEAFEYDKFSQYQSVMDQLGLWLMYDMSELRSFSICMNGKLT